MKIATWNVNGFARARRSCSPGWPKSSPSRVPSGDQGSPAQVPELCKLLEYDAFWHGASAYSGCCST